MMRKLVVVGLVAGCGAPSAHVADLQAAVAKAHVSLAQAATTAEASGGRAVRASLVPNAAPVFAVDAVAQRVDDVRVDAVSAAVLSRTATTRTAPDCAGISLAGAIAAAEGEVAGDAVSAGPDDDGDCNTEVIVLAGDTLWEVKIGPDGALVEPPEKADDDEGADPGE
jgi:hypothetical protein